MRRYALYILIILSVFFNAANAQNIDSLKLELKDSQHDTTRCRILNILAEKASDEEWPKYNELLLNICEGKLKKINRSNAEYKIFQKYYANALNNVGYLANMLGDSRKAMDYYNQCLLIQNEIGNKKGLASCLNNIALIYDKQGDITKALEYFIKNLKIQEEIGDKEGIAISLNNISVIYYRQGDIPKSLEYGDRSIKLREELGDKSGIAISYNNFGLIYFNQGDLSKALDYYKNSLKIRQEINDKRGIAESLSNIGLCYYNTGDIIKALDYHNRSFKIREEVDDKSGMAYSLNNIGSGYEFNGEYSKALEYFQKSLEIREYLGDQLGIANSLHSIAGAYYQLKNYYSAEKFGLNSIMISKQLGYPENIKNTSELLTQIYKATGNHKLALENYELYIKMRDSINNIETQKATIKQQTQYEYDKKKAVEDEKHAAELKVQDEKAQADKKRQNIIIGSVSVVLLLVAVFSILLFNRFKTTQKQKQIIEVKEKETQQQKHIIEEKQKEILDSINYAKRIQYTLLAHEEFLKENLPEHFTYFNPKDIVSGDFYWATKHNNKFYLAVCDSTGHGVPGAFMSLLNIGFLNEAINEKAIEKPNEIFDYVRLKLTNTISKEGQKDGFDGILICIDKSTNKITYAAANNAPILIQNNQLTELNADRMPVGVGERKENFTLHTLELNKGDLLYLYTDGYADQFGGPKGKKFKYKQLNELLLALHTKPLSEQHLELKSAFEKWRGDLEQVDDVCVIGIKI